MIEAQDRFLTYVIDDDAETLKSLCDFLESHGFRTSACRSAEEFLEMFDPDIAACLFLELQLKGMSGTELQTYLNENNVMIPTIMITADGDVPVAVQAMRAGAIDFIEKPASEEQILEALRLASTLLFNRTKPIVSKKIIAKRLERLTDREREVLDQMLMGKLNKEIADELIVSQRTVEGHRSRIREKMQARGVADLIRMLG